MRMWLAGKTSFPVLGQLFTTEWMVLVFSYGGLLIDLLAVPLVLWRRTRPWMYLTLIVFHIFNARLFSIGIFPWMMMIATTIFFEADWPSRMWRDLRSRSGPVVIATLLGGVLIGALALWIAEAFSPVPLLVAIVSGAACGWSFVSSRQPISAGSSRVEAGAASETAAEAPLLPRRQLVLGLVTVWLLVQGLLPLRHLLLPGRSSWTEEGHRFAWHMMLRSKSGSVVLRVTDPATGQVTTVDVAEVLPSWQYSEVVEAPHMLLQFAHITAERFAEIGYPDVEVRAISSVSLNGRPRQLLVDPAVDLASLPRSLAPADYILPLETPLGEGDR